MTETVFDLVSDYGVYVIFASAFLSCLALPIPTSLLMLTGGAFIASGDLTFWGVAMSAFAGAVLGDQTGYFLGRTGGSALLNRLERSSARKAIISRARVFVHRHGSTGVFLSTWAVAPLGPWVNFVAGATGLSWRRFTVSDIMGEAIWVTVYVGLGFLFMEQVSAVSDVMENVLGLIVSLCVAVAAALWLRAVSRARVVREQVS